MRPQKHNVLERQDMEMSTDSSNLETGKNIDEKPREAPESETIIYPLGLKLGFIFVAPLTE